jgi:hypothetical protein
MIITKEKDIKRVLQIIGTSIVISKARAEKEIHPADDNGWDEQEKQMYRDIALYDYCASQNDLPCFDEWEKGHGRFIAHTVR